MIFNYIWPFGGEKRSKGNTTVTVKSSCFGSAVDWQASRRFFSVVRALTPYTGLPLNVVWVTGSHSAPVFRVVMIGWLEANLKTSCKEGHYNQGKLKHLMCWLCLVTLMPWNILHKILTLEKTCSTYFPLNLTHLHIQYNSLFPD